jgi:protein arginine kinase activator
MTEEEHEEEAPLCQECGKRRATVRFTEIVDGKPKLYLLCDACYEKKEGHPAVSPTALLAKFLSAFAPELKELGLTRCPECGISYLEFRQRGTLGCPADYQAFEEGLEPLLEQIHGATEHCGKVPTRAGRQAAVRSQVRSLKRRQQMAVEQEDYERAAVLRDRIQELEAEQDEVEKP